MRIKKLITANLKFFYFFSIIFFFIFYLKLHKYGLPYFVNNDEIAGMKNLLYFYGFFSYANQNIVEPVYYGLINFLSTGFLILLKNFIFWNYSLANLKDFIYLNPDILFGLGRISSIIFCCLSLFFFYLISKKLNFNRFYILVSFLALSFSYLFIDIAIVLGKNSLLLFLFLTQYYFFIKYSKKIEKFNLKSYIILALLGSLAWGVNYWAATPSIYAIIYLHLEKYGLKKIGYIFLFSLIFFVFGILLNYLVTGHEILSLFYNPETIQTPSENSNRFGVFLKDFLSGFKIINNFEKGTLPILFFLILISLFYLKIEKKKFIVFNLVLIFEPIFLFALADKIYPQMRYFGPSFFLIYILIGHLINLILIKNSKFGVILCILICLNYLYFSVEKISILLNVKKIINNKFVEFKIFDNYLNKNSIYISENMIYRENIKTLESYKSLLEKKIVSLNPDSDGKNSLNEIKKKIRIVKRAAKNDISPSSKNYVFYSKEYLVDDVDKLIDFFQLNFDYVIIKDSNKKLTSILQTRFEIENIFTASGIETLRSLTKHLENEFNPEKLKNITHLGSTMIVFKLK